MAQPQKLLKKIRPSLAEFQLLKKKLDESAAIGRLEVIEITIFGDSMRPWMKPGDQLLVRGMQPSQLQVFDPIIFWNGEEAVCHLFLRKNQFRTADGEEAVLTQGLNNHRQDMIVPYSNILGVAIKRKPWWLGLALMWRKWKR